MMNGVNQAAFYILPMLGKHPESYPRFRDCFIQPRGWGLRDDGMPVMTDQEKAEKELAIYVYTRVGGGNRDDYEDQITEMQGHPNYIRDYDDDFDCTYATFVFSIPQEWQKDFDLIIGGKLTETSIAYKEMLVKIFPKLKDQFDAMFTA